MSELEDKNRKEIGANQIRGQGSELFGVVWLHF